jgi:hypothetical protein
MNISCHKGCPDRAVGCHGYCERYKAYRKQLDEENAQKRKLNVISGYNSRIKEIKVIDNFKNPKHFKGGNQN